MVNPNSVLVCAFRGNRQDSFLTLVVVLLDLCANLAGQGLIDGLSLEVLSARGAEAVGRVHGTLERVSLPSTERRKC